MRLVCNSLLSSDDSDSDCTPQSDANARLVKEPLSGVSPFSRLADMSHPPDPVSPLSSSSSISSPVRGRRYSKRSSRSSSSSSTPRSVIKTPSPLPTNQPKFMSAQSSEDDQLKGKETHTTPKKVYKAKKRHQELRKSNGKQNSPFPPGSNSDLGAEYENTVCKIESNSITEAKSKKRVANKEIPSRSISSSSDSSSPSRLPVNMTPNKSKHKIAQKNCAVQSSPVSEKRQNKHKTSSNTNANVSGNWTSASSNINAPTPISPIRNSPLSSPNCNSFVQNNYKTSDERGNKGSEQEQERDFLQPTHPRVLKRPRQSTPINSPTPRAPKKGANLNYVGCNGANDGAKPNFEDIKEGEHKKGNSSMKLLDDISYYPVQQNHKEFVPISTFKEPEYVEFLLLIQVRIMN